MRERVAIETAERADADLSRTIDYMRLLGATPEEHAHRKAGLSRKRRREADAFLGAGGIAFCLLSPFLETAREIETFDNRVELSGSQPVGVRKPVDEAKLRDILQRASSSVEQRDRVEDNVVPFNR